MTVDSQLPVRFFAFSGFEVITASNGTEAIEVIVDSQPDLIIMDMMLPDIDGFTVTSRIRQEGMTRQFFSSQHVTIPKIKGDGVNRWW